MRKLMIRSILGAGLLMLAGCLTIDDGGTPVKIGGALSTTDSRYALPPYLPPPAVSQPVVRPAPRF